MRITESQTRSDKCLADGCGAESELVTDPGEGATCPVEVRRVRYLLLRQTLATDGRASLAENLEDGPFGKLVVGDKLVGAGAALVLRNDLSALVLAYSALERMTLRRNGFGLARHDRGNAILQGLEAVP